MCTRANVLSFRANSASPLLLRSRTPPTFCFLLRFSGNRSILVPPRFIDFLHYRCEEAFVVVVSVLVLRCFGAADESGRRRTTRSRRLCSSALFLSRAGVNINRPPLQAPRENRRVSFPSSSPSSVRRCAPDASEQGKGRFDAREFPVASHQLLTNDPTTKSGGFEAMDGETDTA